MPSRRTHSKMIKQHTLKRKALPYQERQSASRAAALLRRIRGRNACQAPEKGVEYPHFASKIKPRCEPISIVSILPLPRRNPCVGTWF